MSETWNYATEDEAKNLDRDEFDLQMVIGLQTCDTKHDAMQILKDVRRHERMKFSKERGIMF